LELSELETISARLLESEKEMYQLQEEIGRLQISLRELPRKSEKEKKFYALIGMDWDEPKIEEELKQLSKRRDEVAKILEADHSKIVSALSQKQLVVPLDPRPLAQNSVTNFRYRSNATFPNAVKELANILGLSVPLKVDDVTIGFEKISVDEPDALYAQEKIVNAFEKISKTVALKLTT
jgi:hypothetical protein